jgi:hypothetical protein
MSFVPAFLNLLLAALLLTALAVGVRLDRRLKDLRKSHLSFTQAVQELNSASARAQAGLTQLRITAQESGDLLGNRIHQAQELMDQLEQKMVAAKALASAPLPKPVASVPQATEPRVRARPTAVPERLVSPEPRPARPGPVPGLDDDLFDEPEIRQDAETRPAKGLIPRSPLGGRR